MRKYWLLILVIRFVSTVYAQDPIYDVAWTTTSGELWLAGKEREPIQLATNGACCAVFSPKGARLAYVSSDTSGQGLVILDTTNPSEALLTVPSDTFPEGALLGFLAGQGEDKLWLNTLYLSEANLLESDWQLWSVDLASGETTTVSEQGQGAVAFPSPDGQHVIWVYPGIYDETPATISIFDASGTQLTSYDYPAVSSGSHLPWFPHFSWTDEAVRFAIPDPNILYAFDSATPFSEWVELSFDGEVTSLGTAQVIYPAKVVWSPDGTLVAYITPAAAASQNLMVNDQIIQERVPFGTEVLFWRDELVFSVPEEGVFLWTPQDGITHQIEGVVGVTTAPSYALVLVRDSQIVYWENGEETIITEGIPTFDVILAHGLE